MTVEAPTAAPRLIDGPDAAPAIVLLAHGAGAGEPMDSPFMAAIASGLAQRGWRVVRFKFSYMARHRCPAHCLCGGGCADPACDRARLEAISVS